MYLSRNSKGRTPWANAHGVAASGGNSVLPIKMTVYMLATRKCYQMNFNSDIYFYKEVFVQQKLTRKQKKWSKSVQNILQTHNSNKL